jgi:hypothetical protein
MLLLFGDMLGQRETAPAGYGYPATMTLRWSKGGWVWNKPVALLVEAEGHTQQIPIIDVTRVAQMGLWVVSLVVWLIF